MGTQKDVCIGRRCIIALSHEPGSYRSVNGCLIQNRSNQPNALYVMSAIVLYNQFGARAWGSVIAAGMCMAARSLKPSADDLTSDFYLHAQHPHTASTLHNMSIAQASKGNMPYKVRSLVRLSHCQCRPPSAAAHSTLPDASPHD
jgi:hypothetical protein